MRILLPRQMDHALRRAATEAGHATPTEWLRDGILPALLREHGYEPGVAEDTATQNERSRATGEPVSAAAG